jgi:hypothetical protein
MPGGVLPVTDDRCKHALRLDKCPPCSTAALLTELQTTVDHLAANLMPGTTKPWRAPQMSAEKRAELDRQEREDRLHIAQQGILPAHLKGQSVVVPPGENPAPYDLDVADLLASILVDVDMLADLGAHSIETDLLDWAGAWARDLCARSLLPTLAPASATSAFADPAPHIAFLADHLDVIAYVDPDLLKEIAEKAQRHIDAAKVLLGHILDGQLLPLMCPWCRGRTGAHPMGGERTLRIRLSLGEEPRPLVVCEGGACEPGTASGVRWKGLPAWDLINEGAWLGECIKVRDDATECRCGRPVLRTGKAGRPAAFCSEECRREADAERQRMGRAS